MNVRACIVRGTRPELEAIEAAAPTSLRVMFREQFDHNLCELRLEGPALPDWCEIRPGGAYPWARAQVRDGVLYVTWPGPGMPDEPVR